jgi:hypothetical protein
MLTVSTILLMVRYAISKRRYPLDKGFVELAGVIHIHQCAAATPWRQSAATLWRWPLQHLNLTSAVVIRTSIDFAFNHCHGECLLLDWLPVIGFSAASVNFLKRNHGNFGPKSMTSFGSNIPSPSLSIPASFSAVKVGRTD